MKSNYLFPYYWRYIGLGCFILALISAILFKVTHPHGFSQGIGAPQESGMRASYLINNLLIIMGLLLVAFSKEKIEDEQVSQLRSDSLQQAIYFNYVMLIIGIVVSRGYLDLLFIVAPINLWTPVVFFILRFKWKIWQLNIAFKKNQ